MGWEAGGGWGGGGFIAIKIQCRLTSNSTTRFHPALRFMKKKKEKEWELNSMNRRGA